MSWKSAKATKLKERARGERDRMIERWNKRGLSWDEIAKLLGGGEEFVREQELKSLHINVL